MTETAWDAWRGHDLYDSHGDKIGSVDEIYDDDDTGTPEWLAVNTGFFGSNQSFVPISAVSVRDDGLVTTYSKDEIKEAPNVDPSMGHLSAEGERRLYEFYGQTYSAPTSVTGRTDLTQRQGDQTQEMTATNEQVQKTAETEGVRLRKRTWTEEVPVQREEIVVERDTDLDTDSDIRR